MELYICILSMALLFLVLTVAKMGLPSSKLLCSDIRCSGLCREASKQAKADMK